MKIFKRVYLIALPLLLALVITLGFVHAFHGGRAYKTADGFAGEAKVYADKLNTRENNYSTNPNKTDESEKIRGNLVYFLSNSVEPIQLKSVSTESNKEKRDAEGNIIYDENEKALTHHSIVKYSNVAEPEISYYNLGSNGYTVSDDTIQKLADKLDDGTYIPVDRIVNNLTVVVPGQKTKDNAKQYKAHLDWLNANPGKTAEEAAAAGSPAITPDAAPDAILITAHMDFARGSAGGADLATLGTVLNEIYELKMLEKADKEKSKYQNDIIFLFTDSRYDANYGIYTFLEQFYGFETRENNSVKGKLIIPDIVSRIKLCVNLDSIGGGDSAILLQTSKHNANAVKGFTKAVGAVSSSFVSDIYANFPSDFNGFGDNITAVNLVTFGDMNTRNTKYETVDSISESVYAKKAQMLLGTLDYFGDYDLDGLESESTVKYFSVLGLFTVRYTNVVSYVFGALVLLLILAVVLVNRKKKAFKFSSTGKGILVQLISICAALLSMFALYFILGLLLSGLGLFTIQSLATFAYTNIGIMIGYILLAAALTGLFYGIFKKFFNIKAPDIVRGGAAIWAVIGAVLAFAYPALGLMAAIPAILVLAVMLLSTLFKEKFKNKFGFDIERMFFYLVPMIFALAMLTPSFAILAVSVRALLMPVVILPFIMAFALIMPYTAALKPAMDRFLAKMPKHTIRVQRTVTERVADKAKPGKFSEVTSTKIVKEKIAWKYKNGVGMAIVAVIACVVIMASSALGVPFGAATYVNNKEANFGVNRMTESLYDSSLLLVWSRTGISTNAAKATLEIHDKAAYKYLRGTVAGYKWDTDKNAYVKPFDGDATFMQPTFEESGTSRVKFTPAEFPGLGRGISEVVIYGASSITKVTVMDSAYAILEDNAARKEVYANNGNDTITLRLPTDADKSGGKYEGFVLEFEFNSSKTNDPFKIALNQYIWDTTGDALFNILKDIGNTDITDINSYMGKLNDEAVKASMKYGIVFNLEKMISL